MVNQESAPGAPGTLGSSEDPRIDARTRRGRLMMLFLLLVCASPVIASYLAYYVFTPAGGKAAYGALVDPQRPIPTGLMVQDEHGAEVPLASLKGKWLMVSVDGSACDDNCARKLFTMRQLRIGQGPDRDRIVPVWLVTDRGRSTRASSRRTTTITVPCASCARPSCRRTGLPTARRRRRTTSFWSIRSAT